MVTTVWGWPLWAERPQEGMAQGQGSAGPAGGLLEGPPALVAGGCGGDVSSGSACPLGRCWLGGEEERAGRPLCDALGCEEGHGCGGAGDRALLSRTAPWPQGPCWASLLPGRGCWLVEAQVQAQGCGGGSFLPRVPRLSVCTVTLPPGPRMWRGVRALTRLPGLWPLPPGLTPAWGLGACPRPHPKAPRVYDKGRHVC